jgi:alpha-D-xyloside xylohydrolase
MPYIYSQAWQVTSNHATLMRPLVMDWREDVEAQNTGDEYLFGPSILVSPVTKQGATSREVYLPQSIWYDFWTGEKIDASKAGIRMQADAPLSKLPLYIRAGSIIPMGPKMEWTTEKPSDPIELRIYPGADGDFTLYEDQNDGYQYENGAHATIPMHWDDAAHTLTIAAREGTFPGMLAEHTFRIVVVDKVHGTGIAESQSAEATVVYKGAKLQVRP